MESIGGLLYHPSAGVALKFWIVIVAVCDPLKLFFFLNDVAIHQRKCRNPPAPLRWPE